MNKKVILRVIRNVAIAILSIGWIAPTIAFLIVFLKGLIALNWHGELPPDLSYLCCVGNDFFFMSSMSFFVIAAIWLAVVIVFWTIVAANRLWLTKGKKDEKEDSVS